MTRYVIGFAQRVGTSANQPRWLIYHDPISVRKNGSACDGSWRAGACFLAARFLVALGCRVLLSLVARSVRRDAALRVEVRAS